ncbi:MAG: undecaprenyl/decaprenyl-phosphate alpha-N-acetylglucosaminyl 1-phosphate transferase [Nitrospirota bacterium]|nr:undecaprenyl/decaprenyl-phosphate alpha-N-acetylglucosaminyl 1-phosphate transferase [Nitrospirota bacterium]
MIYLLTFILALGFSLYGTPLAREAAIKFGIVDKPDGRLKVHAEPVAYLGGFAIYLSFLFALALTFEFSHEVLGLILGGTIIVMIGLIDDFGVLTPAQKLLGQMVAVFVLIKSGIYIKLAYLPFPVQISLTVLWLVGVTNGFNLIDIMDGLSAGVAATAAIVLFAVSIINGREMIAIMSIAMAGSLIGFLRYNYQPAKIYMGDTGSMFVGFMLAALAMNGSYTKINHVAAVAPVLILGVPIFETVFLSYVRWRRGVSILKGSKDHFALRLRKWRLSVRQTVNSSYAIAFLLGGIAIAMTEVSTVYAATLLAVTLVSCLVAAFWLKKIDMTV